MKFIHIADLHLGKIIYQQNLLPIQVDLLDQVLDYMVIEDIDVLVMAGDIYDRSIASSDTISVLDNFLTKAITKYHKIVLMIAGNHDSAQRLNFGSSILSSQGLHIVSFIEKELKPIIVDNVNFYLVPFFKPSDVKNLYPDYEITTYNDAYEYYLNQQDIDYTKTNVLVTHQFISGNSENIRSDSESVTMVGGSEIIGVDLVKDFDYVALGHLHAGQKISKETIRYSGSLMKYSFDEVNQVKGMVEVSINNKEVSCKQINLNPKIDLLKYEDYFDNFMEREDIDSRNYLSLAFKDTHLIINAKDRLRDKYPNILQISYPVLNAITSSNNTKAESGFEKKSILDVFEEFYNKVSVEPLDEQSKDIVQNIIEEGDYHDA